MAWIENKAELREAQREGWVDEDGKVTKAGKARMELEQKLLRDGYRGDPRTASRKGH